MKFKANPVIVDAFEILSVGIADENAYLPVALDNGSNEEASPQMTARYMPVAGDYWVVQEDGYIYINPRDVFLRKYSAVAAPDEGDQASPKEQAA